MADFNIVEKGVSLDIKTKEGAAVTNLYVGAGWDMDGGKSVDLDLVGACLSNGKLIAQTRLVYFGDKTEPGVQLSEDNRTGAGDDDDENMIIDFSKVEADVTEIAVGLCAYSGADLSSAKNVKFRLVNGKNANDNQILEVPVARASTGDTVLHAATLKRGANGWTVENVGTFHKKGTGTSAIQGFANLFAA